MPAMLTVDLGVRTCRAAIRTVGGLQTISFGGRSEFPNVVGVAPKGQLIVGVDAERQSATRPAETAVDYLRWLGAVYSQPSFEKMRGQFSYPLARTHTGIDVILQHTPRSPIALIAQVFAALRDAAQDLCGEEVHEVALAVPSAWDTRQIREIKAAAESVGLRAVKVLPRLVALALSQPFASSGRRWIIHISPASIEWGMIERTDHGVFWRDSGGDQFFGFDALCADLLEIQLASFETHHGVVIGRRSQAYVRLREAFEKKLLCDGPLVVQLPFIAEKDGKPLDFAGEWNGAAIAAALTPWINAFSAPLRRFLKLYQPGDDVWVNGALLARTDLRQQLTVLLPAPAQLLGADAACTGLLTDLVYHPCSAESVGVGDHRGIFHRIFPRHAQPPCEMERDFEVTCDAAQGVAGFAVYQGERRKAQENKWLGNFEFLPLTGKMKAVERVKVRFSLTETGQLNITARQAGQQIATQKVILL